jgi:hypothetical protein
MRYAIRFVVLFAVLSSSCSDARRVDGSGTLAQELRTVDDFEGVAFADGLQGRVETGEKSVAVSIDDNLLAFLETVVEAGTLQVRFKSDIDGHPTSSDVRITGPKVGWVYLSGASKVQAAMTPKAVTELALSGGSEVTATAIEADELKVSASGGSRVKVDGAATKLGASATGESRIESTIPTADVEVSLSGGSELTARASRSAKGAASGGSKVTITGSPADRAIATSGGSEVVYVEESGAGLTSVRTHARHRGCCGKANAIIARTAW